MSKNLIIVESPTKARTIKRILGGDYEVMASMGHVRDLPKSKLGVDEENDFEPTYVTLKSKQKTVSGLKKAAAGVENIYLAADPDREGESICYHLTALLDDKGGRFYRVTFNEITTPAVKRAFENPTEIDMNKVEAQQARRILDRLVGYKISPLLWRKVKKGLSAGRVQSVALRLIADREREINEFQTEEYWKIAAELLGENEPSFTANLIERDGQKLELHNEEEATVAVRELEQQAYAVRSLTVKKRRRNPPQPFITSTLQQDAFRRLGFPVARTMRLAQKLYEGIPLPDKGQTALITYMRTDSTRVSSTAQQAAREFIAQNYGSDNVPARPPKPKKVKAAQEAHEAIRPTYVDKTPESLEGMMEKDLFKLYRLIWQRFVASQMAPAEFEVTTVDVEAGRYMLRASGTRMLFPGFTTVAGRRNENDEEKLLPQLREGESLKLLELTPTQNFTQPPPRYSEASLVRVLEEKGIGRPSTYATIISVIQNREYVRKEKGRLLPTDLGLIVTELLVENFSDLLDYDYTARMEEILDRIEEGKEKWTAALGRFNKGFTSDLEAAEEKMRNVRREVVPTDEVCEKCGSQMVIRWGRYGRFLACSSYPECKHSKPLPDAAADEKKQKLEKVAAALGEQVSDVCGTPLVLRSGRYGFFLGCSRYPECKYTVPVKKDGTIAWNRAKKKLCAESGDSNDAENR